MSIAEENTEETDLDQGIEDNEAGSIKVMLSRDKKQTYEGDFEEARNYGDFFLSSRTEGEVRNIPLYGLDSANGLLRSLGDYESVEVDVEEGMEEQYEEVEEIVDELERGDYSNIEVHRVRF